MLKLPSGCARPSPGAPRLRTARRPSVTRTRRLPMIAFCRPYGPLGCLDSRWSDENPRERLLIRLVDELHDTSGISDGFWRELELAFSVEQIFELIALVGFYHTGSFFAKGFKLAPEPCAAPVGLTPKRTIGVRSAGDADLAQIAEHAGMDEIRAWRRGERVRGGRLLGLRQAPGDRGLAPMKGARQTIGHLVGKVGSSEDEAPRAHRGQRGHETGIGAGWNGQRLQEGVLGEDPRDPARVGCDEPRAGGPLRD